MTIPCRRVERLLPIHWVFHLRCFLDKMLQVGVGSHRISAPFVPHLKPGVFQAILLQRFLPMIPNGEPMCSPKQHRKQLFFDMLSKRDVGVLPYRLHWGPHSLPAMFPAIHHNHRGWSR